MQPCKLPDTGNLLLRHARVPAGTLADVKDAPAPGSDGLVETDIAIDDGRVVGLGLPLQRSSAAMPVIDLDGAQVWPCYVDIHTHLDKTHSAERTPNTDYSLLGAIRADQRDQANHWNDVDLRKRMNFALQCAYAHGTAAMRTHLVSTASLRRLTWDVFTHLQETWADRITLQAVSQVAMEDLIGTGGRELADFVAERGGVLGCTISGSPGPDIAPHLDTVFALAAQRELDLDFHADENLDPDSHALRYIAETALRTEFSGKVAIGHCCSLSVQHVSEVKKTLDLVAKSGVAIIGLPGTDLYQQDRHPGHTPRYRGITRLHEMQQRDIAIALGSDACRDLFHPFGDCDLHAVFAQAALLGHLDSDLSNWPLAVNRTAAELMGLADTGTIAVGSPADLIIFSARSYGELLSRPQADRLVLRQGKPIDTTLPDYRLLD
ncbi:cytosine deaminase [Exilibacterium tricleocarpae]|nr:cytosine deaminase [Exilibacterium tricleocarpae]